MLQPNFADFSRFREEVSVKSDFLLRFVSGWKFPKCSEQQHELSLRKDEEEEKKKKQAAELKNPVPDCQRFFSTPHIFLSSISDINVSLRSRLTNLRTSISRPRWTGKGYDGGVHQTESEWIYIQRIYLWPEWRVAQPHSHRPSFVFPDTFYNFILVYALLLLHASLIHHPHMETIIILYNLIQH